jgi:hypothetical protein
MKDLTKKELAYVIEALLFASCCDICAEWEDEDIDQFVAIAKKIQGRKNVELKKIHLFGVAKNYEDKKTASYIKKNFKINKKR